MLIRSWRRGSRPTDGTLKESENRLMIGTLYTDRNRSEKPSKSKGQSKVAGERLCRDLSE
jgi:hypothetical protein